MLMRAATAVQVLQDLFLCFIACFILLVIAPLGLTFSTAGHGVAHPSGAPVRIGWVEFLYVGAEPVYKVQYCLPGTQPGMVLGGGAAEATKLKVSIKIEFSPCCVMAES